jgi:hypothetical protein
MLHSSSSGLITQCLPSVFPNTAAQVFAAVLSCCLTCDHAASMFGLSIFSCMYACSGCSAVLSLLYGKGL